jgi:hypothetical protein
LRAERARGGQKIFYQSRASLSAVFFGGTGELRDSPARSLSASAVVLGGGILFFVSGARRAFLLERKE